MHTPYPTPIIHRMIAASSARHLAPKAARGSGQYHEDVQREEIPSIQMTTARTGDTGTMATSVTAAPSSGFQRSARLNVVLRRSVSLQQPLNRQKPYRKSGAESLRWSKLPAYRSVRGQSRAMRRLAARELFVGVSVPAPEIIAAGACHQRVPPGTRIFNLGENRVMRACCARAVTSS